MIASTILRFELLYTRFWATGIWITPNRPGELAKQPRNGWSAKGRYHKSSNARRNPDMNTIAMAKNNEIVFNKFHTTYSSSYFNFNKSWPESSLSISASRVHRAIRLAARLPTNMWRAECIKPFFERQLRRFVNFLALHGGIFTRVAPLQRTRCQASLWPPAVSNLKQTCDKLKQRIHGR